MANYPLAFQAGIVMPGAGAHSLPLSSLASAIATPFEPFADYHWMFGADNPTLTDMVQGAVIQRNIILTVTAAGTGYEAIGPLVFTGTATKLPSGFFVANGSGVIQNAYITDPGVNVTAIATITPTTAAGTGATITSAFGGAGTTNPTSFTTSAGARQGMLTPVPDSVEETWAIVAKINKNTSSATQVLFGTAVAQNFAKGSMLYNDRAVPMYKSMVRGGATANVDPPAATVTGQYVFMAVSYRADGANVVYYGGPTATKYESTGQVKALDTNGYRICVGMGPTHYQSAQFSLAVEAGELLRIPKGITANDLDQVYARSKARMAARGIAVY